MSRTYKIEGEFLPGFIVTGNSHTVVCFEIRIAFFHRPKYEYSVQTQTFSVVKYRLKQVPTDLEMDYFS